MPRWWHYPSSRRVALQVIMWALFGATLGLAAIVTSHRQRLRDANFSAPLACGPYTVRVPASWKLIKHAAGDVKVEAVEVPKVRRQTRPRRLIFVQKQIPADTPAEQYLMAEPLIGVGQLSDDDDNAGGRMEDVAFAGYSGALYIKPSVRMVAIIAAFPVTDYSAAVVAPDGQALAVKMTVDATPSEADLTEFQELLDRITRNAP